MLACHGRHSARSATKCVCTSTTTSPPPSAARAASSSSAASGGTALNVRPASAFSASRPAAVPRRLDAHAPSGRPVRRADASAALAKRSSARSSRGVRGGGAYSSLARRSRKAGRGGRRAIASHSIVARSMRAAVAREYGPPETLRIEERPAPSPGPGEVRVRVRAAAVNYPDLLVLANQYQRKVELPFTPGSELAGEVSACGPGASGLAPGDRVYGAALIGAFAEEIALPAATLFRIPDGVGFAAAAAFGVAYTTAWGALVSAGGLRAGETLLVLGAAGGVGLAVSELGRELGARVIVAASSDVKRALCAAKGAALELDSAPETLRERLRAAAPRVVDVVIDPVGGAATEA